MLKKTISLMCIIPFLLPFLLLITLTDNTHENFESTMAKVDKVNNFEETYGVNCLFVVGLVSLESDFGNSHRANNGSNNLTGHGVYNQQSRGSRFDSKEDCINETFRLLSEDYLCENGIYFNGYSIWNVNTKYSQSNRWASQINQIIRDLS